MSHKKTAFTLIELLVVIAIIGLLLAIIAPSLQLAKERAQFILCKVNLKAYGLALKLYVTENNDEYPTDCWNVMWAGDKGYSGNPWGLPDVSNDLDCQWHDKRISPNNNPGFAGPLWQYMDADDAHMCPTFRKFARTLGKEHPGHNTNIPIDPQYAYSFNVFLGSRKPNSDDVWGVKKETEVINPANVLSWVEETIWLIPSWAGWTLNDTCFFSRHDDDTTQWGDFIATYHGTSIARPDDGKGNAVFLDGHVELLDPYYTVDLGGKEARAGFIHSWPLKGKLSPTSPY